jgi:hypothetical protein
VLDPEIIEQPKCLAGEVAELGVVPFSLKFRNDNNGNNDFVLGETQQRPRIREQNGRVNNEAANGGFPSGDNKTGRRSFIC